MACLMLEMLSDLRANRAAFHRRARLQECRLAIPAARAPVLVRARMPVCAGFSAFGCLVYLGPLVVDFTAWGVLQQGFAYGGLLWCCCSSQIGPRRVCVTDSGIEYGRRYAWQDIDRIWILRTENDALSVLRIKRVCGPDDQARCMTPGIPLAENPDDLWSELGPICAEKRTPLHLEATTPGVAPAGGLVFAAQILTYIQPPMTWRPNQERTALEKKANFIEYSPAECQQR